MMCIAWIRNCCNTPLDQPHAKGCKTLQDDDPWCRKGDDIGVNREKDYGYVEAEKPGEAIARAFERTDP